MNLLQEIAADSGALRELHRPHMVREGVMFAYVVVRPGQPFPLLQRPTIGSVMQYTFSGPLCCLSWSLSTFFGIKTKIQRQSSMKDFPEDSIFLLTNYAWSVVCCSGSNGE